MLGTGQLSLAKFLFITADETNNLTTKNIQHYIQFVLERIQPQRDIHFYTKTTIDTLDYSGENINQGSKVVFAAYGQPVRKLATENSNALNEIRGFTTARMVIPGVVAIGGNAYQNQKDAKEEIQSLGHHLSLLLKENKTLSKAIDEEIVLIVLCDDPAFLSANLNNFLWTTFTRSNPSHDIYGVDEFYDNKHWGCKGPIIIDARAKPHHAPPVEKDPETEKKINRLFEKGGSLFGV
jgi:4-hydroxy-3-polyprenylbenzoate decarboxylase